MTWWRIAGGTILGSGRLLWWRRLCVPAAGVLSTFVLLAYVGLVVSAFRTGERLQARVPVASSDASARFFEWGAFDVVDEVQVPVTWIEPVAGRPLELPPGVEALPPGAFAVSPALDAAADRDELVDARYSPRSTIGDEGLASRDELLAYARPAGPGVLEPVGFGASSWGSPYEEAPEVDPRAILVAGALTLAIPALLLMVGALTTAADLRDRRSVLLAWMGAPRSATGKVAAREAALLLAPAGAVGAIIWAAASQRALTAPTVGYTSVAGDLWVGLGPTVLLVVAWVLLLTVVARVLAGRAVRRIRATPRPTVDASSLSTWRLVPSVIGALLVTGAAAMRGDPLAFPVLVLGVAVLLVGLPLVLPSLLGKTGVALAAGRSVVATLAGRRLQADPAGGARPLLALSAFLLLALVAVSYVSAVRQPEPVPVVDPQLESASLRFVDGPSDEAGLVRDRLPDGWLVFPVNGDVGALGLGCSDLDAVLGDVACADGGLSPSAQQRLGEVLRLPTPLVQYLHLVDPAELGSERAELVVVGPRGPRFEDTVRAAAVGLVAPDVAGVSGSVLREGRLVRWLLAGMAAAAVLTSLAAICTLIDRSLRVSRQHLPLLRLGVVPARLRRLEAAQFALTCVVALGAATVFGVGSGIGLSAISNVPHPWPATVAVVAAAACVGLISTAVVGWCSTSVGDGARAPGADR
jgi:hypothetical protein